MARELLVRSGPLLGALLRDPRRSRGADLDRDSHALRRRLRRHSLQLPARDLRPPNLQRAVHGEPGDDEGRREGADLHGAVPSPRAPRRAPEGGRRSHLLQRPCDEPAHGRWQLSDVPLHGVTGHCREAHGRPQGAREARGRGV